VAETPSTFWVVQRLDKQHDRTAFDCGNAPLNQWIQRLAGQYERRDLARTYVAVRTGEASVLGYYAISSHRVCFDALLDEHAKGLPALDVPVLLLGRLAVDRNSQGCGLGEHLLMDALRRAEYLSQHVGIRAVEVDAIDEDARRFYLKYGFDALHDDRRHLFLPMQVIRQLHLPPL
jgi:GNAT superfamily N-acetyltransferase